VSDYDAIVIGGGHNGLVCAAYLARAQRRVCVLEQAQVLGGCSTTESLLADHPGFRFNRGAIDLAHIQGTPILDELELERHGLKLIYHEPMWYFVFPDGTSVSFFRDINRTCESIGAFSAEDAESYRRFADMWQRALVLLAPLDEGPAPSVGKLAALAAVAGRDGDALAHLLLSSPQDVAHQWFRSPQMLAVMGWMGVQAGTPPEQPAAALATAQLAVSHENGVARAEGGMGALMDALRRAIETDGGEVRLSARVDRVVLDASRRRVEGVGVDGEVLTAPVVVSAIDAYRLFTRLAPEAILPPALRRRITHAHAYYPSLFKVDVALSAKPTIPHPGGAEGVTANINIAPSFEHVQQAFHQYAQGKWTPDPPLMAAVPSVLDPSLAPEGQHTLWLSQFNPGPYWKSADEREREACAESMIETFCRYAPGTESLVLDRHITTPADRERITGNLDGSPFHLDMTLDQSLAFRPVVGMSGYRTPVAGLFLSGSGTHPGGGVTGVPGRNAAHAVLEQRPKVSELVRRAGPAARTAWTRRRAWHELRERL
jgi:beta-carotene ketolase (CrtO type)